MAYDPVIERLRCSCFEEINLRASFFFLHFLVVVLGQIFGIFPIYGIMSRDPQHLRLKWFSVRVILNLTVVFTALMQAYFEYQRLATIGVNAKNVSGLIFFIDACLINVLFLNLATGWRAIAVKWTEVDHTFNRPPFQMVGWSLRKRLRVISFTLLFLALGKSLLVYELSRVFFSSKLSLTLQWNIFFQFSVARTINISR